MISELFRGRNVGFYSVFVRCLGFTPLRENIQNLTNWQIAVFSATMLAKTSQIAAFFERVFKNTVNSGVVDQGLVRNIAICSGVCLAG